jgi:uncharacterized membrane protein
MEISNKNLVLFAAIVLTGLSAGLFYAWKISVIPGTKRVNDLTYIQVMQEINRAIINPAFMLLFMGSLFIQVLSVIQHRNTNVFWILLAAFVTYFGGTILVTILGNVPLNNNLESLKISGMSPEQLSQNRNSYETKWNKLHTIRSLFAILSFVLLLAGQFINRGN